MTPRAPFLVLLLLLSIPAAAQLPRNALSASAGWTDLASVGGERSLGASYARYWSDAIATRAGFATGDLLNDVHVMAEYHALRARRLSPWLGAGVAHLTFDNGQSTSQNSLMVGGGLDVTVSRSLAIGAEVHYTKFVIDPSTRFEFNVNPMRLALAARWRF